MTPGRRADEVAAVPSAAVPSAAARSEAARAAVLRAAQTLRAAGVASARHDAEALARFVLGCDRALGSSPPWDAPARRRFEALVERRARREPLQHLTGRAPFRHLEIAVGPGVFVPRPETEGLVDLVLDRAGPGSVVVDLCAGSGAVALAVATERPGTEVHAVECEAVALRWLRRNVGDLVIVHPADVRDALPELDGSVDVVVSNPPYLPDGLVLEPEVGAHDPAASLWGGPDGLTTIRWVVAAAARLLRPGGLLALEHDESHQAAVRECLQGKGFGGVVGHRDLTGRDRYVTGVRMAP